MGAGDRAGRASPARPGRSDRGGSTERARRRRRRRHRHPRPRRCRAWPEVAATAVDPSPGMLAVGRAAAGRTLSSSAGRRLRWRTGTAEQLPLDDGSADIVVSSFAFQHLRSRIAALGEAYRVLRPGGTVVVTWLTPDPPFEPRDQYKAVLHDFQLVRPATREVYRPFRSTASAAALVRRTGSYAHTRSRGSWRSSGRSTPTWHARSRAKTEGSSRRSTRRHEFDWRRHGANGSRAWIPPRSSTEIRSPTSPAVDLP